MRTVYEVVAVFSTGDIVIRDFPDEQQAYDYFDNELEQDERGCEAAEIISINIQ